MMTTTSRDCLKMSEPHDTLSTTTDEECAWTG